MLKTSSRMMFSLPTMLAYHLSCNHYPPLPQAWVPACERAINKARRGEWNKKVRFPNGAGLVDVWTVIDACHLHDFIGEPGEYEE